MPNSPFNLPPPSDFRGLNPDIPITTYQRILPHWRQQGATYFVTSRLADALPQQKLQLLKRIRIEWELKNPPPQDEATWQQFSQTYSNRAERWLDEGYGACHFRDHATTNVLRDTLLHYQAKRYHVACFAIMPNHFHLVIRPFESHRLEDVVGSMKGFVARTINKSRGTTGAIWTEESYDRIIRDEEHLWRVIQYIGRNPRMAGLADEAKWRCWIDPTWTAIGWKFVDPTSA